MSLRSPLILSLAVTIGSTALPLSAQTLNETNYDQLVPEGKEVDAIYGDIAVVNDAAKAIIAAPLSTRNANMTVRTVAGSLLDLATTDYESDQLSCFYPGRRKFPFSEVQTDGTSTTVISHGTDSRPECHVTYQLMEGQPILSITTTWKNTTGQDWTPVLEDDIRADGGKEEMIKSPNGTHQVVYIADNYWRQAYAITAEGFRIRTNRSSRESVLAYEPAEGKLSSVAPGEEFSFTRHLAVAENLPEALALAGSVQPNAPEFTRVRIHMTDGLNEPAAGALVDIASGGRSLGTVRLDATGHASTRLSAGTYKLTANVGGVPLHAEPITAEVDANTTLLSFTNQSTYKPGTARVSVVDGKGNAIPAKVEFDGNGDAPTPNWGPETAEHFVRNLAYTEDGQFEVPLQQGEYDVIVSHGPEYDAVFTKLTVLAGKTAELKATLKRVVSTPGWVSSDFHSHSSPSGDNTGSQLGRVLNLAAEHVEFAPCTEHNRVSTYEHHIAALKLKPFLATVSGMELTGSPLPLNHQNVFPLIHKPRTQDGGGPTTDGSPEAQMERIFLWDNRSEKLIQQNHPDIGWLFYDKNGDGKPDEGYSRTFNLMNVMEIHPIDRILNLTRFDERNGKPFGNNRMLNWLQLLNQGHRIFGVVNTDAHYNFHGSGGLRNWIRSSTDDPAKIDSTEMMKAARQGHLIMSNGPYLSVTYHSQTADRAAVSGEELTTGNGQVTANVKVQCPNWINVDTVFLLVNGRRSDALTFTAKDHPELFKDGTVRFEKQIQVPLSEDSHIIAVAGHQTEVLGDVAGGTWANQHPAAVANPVFVDVNGDGFAPNKDTLDHPLPVKFGT